MTRVRCAAAARRLAGLLAAAVVGLASLGPAAGHPEIVMRCRVLFNFQGPAVTAIGQSWSFDEPFSAQLLADFDRDRDGSFSAAESADLAKKVLPNLAEAHYLTYLAVDGADLGKLAPFDFKAVAQHGIVTFAFALRLPRPVDPATAALTLGLKDPGLTIYVTLSEKEPVVLRGENPKHCRARVRDAESEAYLHGTVTWPEITLDCAG